MLPVLRLPPGHLFLPVTAWAQPDKAKVHRRLCEPLTDDRTENTILKAECGELCSNGADGDKPRPSGEVEVQSNEQIGEPEQREQAAQA